MVFNVCCTKCSRDNKRSYDLFNFVEHYAEVHLGGFHTFTCPRCRQHFASNFSANYHMASCWDQNVSPSVYSRPFRVGDLEDVDEIKAAMDDAISVAVERLVEEKLEMRSKSEDMIIDEKRGNNNYDPPCPLFRRQEERRRRDRRTPERRSRSRERGDDRRSYSRDRSRDQRCSFGRDDRRRDEPPRPMSFAPTLSMSPYSYNPMPRYQPPIYQQNLLLPYAYPRSHYPSYSQNNIPQSLGNGIPRPVLVENKSKLDGPMSVVNMKLFDEKTDETDSVLEVDGAKGFIQMHFDSKFLSKASPYFKKLFNSPEFLNSSDNRMTIARPYVSFIDVMNVLHYKSLPWKMRCRQYFMMGNLHRIYRALKEALELELPSVTAFLGESMFRQRCFAGEDVCDCTTCIERVVLALHFGIKIPEDLKFPEECCQKWLSDCAIYSCAPELDMVAETTRFISGMHK